MSTEPQTTVKKTARERIRATAAELFYRQGIRAVGVDELVSRAKATKPSLYRSFESKDELAADYLRDFAASFWARFESAVSAREGDPRAQLRELFERSGQRTRDARYRGCGLTNAAVEYPDVGHPARQVVTATKQEVRRRLTAMVTALGALDPKLLADGLTMLLEGAYVSRQLFGSGGPAKDLGKVADRMIDGWPRRRARTRKPALKDRRVRQKPARG